MTKMRTTSPSFCDRPSLARALKQASELRALEEDPDNNIEVVNVNDPIKELRTQKSEAVRARIMSKHLMRLLFPV